MTAERTRDSACLAGSSWHNLNLQKCLGPKVLFVEWLITSFIARLLLASRARDGEFDRDTSPETLTIRQTLPTGHTEMGQTPNRYTRSNGLCKHRRARDAVARPGFSLQRSQSGDAVRPEQRCQGLVIAGSGSVWGVGAPCSTAASRSFPIPAKKELTAATSRRRMKCPGRGSRKKERPSPPNRPTTQPPHPQCSVPTCGA